LHELQEIFSRQDSHPFLAVASVKNDRRFRVGGVPSSLLQGGIQRERLDPLNFQVNARDGVDDIRAVGAAAELLATTRLEIVGSKERRDLQLANLALSSTVLRHRRSLVRG